MGLFATKTRAGHTDGPGAGQELSEAVRQTLPDRFVAVGEALASGSGSVESCDVAGRSLAQDGASLDEALQGLRATTQSRSPVRIRPSPTSRPSRVAWSEATLAYLHRVSCEDPLTGLASLAHVRSRLSELYRCYDYGDGTVPHTHALVVLELPEDRPGDRVDPDQLLPVTASGPARRDRAHRLPRAPRRSVAWATTGSLVLAQRDDRLGRRTSLLRTMLLLRAVPHPALDRGAAGHRRLRGRPARRAGPRLTLPAALSVPPTRLAACAAAMPPLAVPRT